MGWLPGSGCVLWLQMDESKENTVYDLSGQENRGARIGAQWKRGKIGFALEFDGVDDYVEVAYSPSFDITGQITLEAQVKGFDFSNPIEQLIIDSSPRDWRLWTYARRLYFGFYDDAGNLHMLGTGYALSDAHWYHVVGLYDGQYLRGYVNGDEVRSEYIGAYTIRTTANKRVSVGGYLLAAGYSVNGLIDEVRLYSRALSPEEVRSRYWYGTVPSLGPLATGARCDSF